MIKKLLSVVQVLLITYSITQAQSRYKLDSSFHQMGYRIDSVSNGIGAVLHEVCLLNNDGTMWVSGRSKNNSNFNCNRYLHALKSDGTNQTSFGTNGKQEINYVLSKFNLTHAISILPMRNSGVYVTCNSGGGYFAPSKNTPAFYSQVGDSIDGSYFAASKINDSILVMSDVNMSVYAYSNNAVMTTNNYHDTAYFNNKTLNNGAVPSNTTTLYNPFQSCLRLLTGTDGALYAVGRGKNVAANRFFITITKMLPGQLSLDNTYGVNGIAGVYGSDNYMPLNSAVIDNNNNIYVEFVYYDTVTLQRTERIICFNSNGSINSNYNNGLGYITVNKAIVKMAVDANNNLFCLNSYGYQKVLESYTVNGLPNNIGDTCNYLSFNKYYLTMSDISINSQNEILLVGWASDTSSVNPTSQSMGIIFKLTNSTNTTNGISKFDSKNVITVYPNPASNYAMINSVVELNSIEVRNVLGQQVKCEWLAMADNDYKLNVENLTKGIYFVKIVTLNGDEMIEKIIKD
ncbi:MAG: hypothetical protein RIQ33_973 [Bacteroidota bacterium]|jgi:hypothetical protein